MRTLLIGMAVVALAACNETQVPAQSQATASASASSGATPAPDKEPKAPPVLDPSAGALLAAETARPEGDLVDVGTAAGRAQLQEGVAQMMDEAVRQLGADYRPDPGIAPQYPLLRLRDSPYLFQMTLNQGVNYRFVGGCDGDCNNVDLELADSTGRVIGSDLLPDDFPAVSFTPPASGVYTVRVHLRTCAVEPCMVALRTLVR